MTSWAWARALQYYFGKDVRDLSIAEAAVIASITQNPSKYNPYTRPENIRARQRLVLQKMYELEFITEEEYKQARGEELHFKNGLKHAAVEDYYMDLLVEDVIADLMDVKGYTYRMAQNMVYHGGLTIRSAEKPAQQKAVEEIYANEKNFPKSIAKDKEDPPPPSSSWIIPAVWWPPSAAVGRKPPTGCSTDPPSPSGSPAPP